MGVASGCSEQEAGVASGSGCGCKEVYIFPHDILLIPTPLVSVLFCSFLMFFRSCSSTFL